MELSKIIINPDLIAPPFTFNPLKHHLGFMQRLLQYKDMLNDQDFFTLINSIGPQLTDIYTGRYSVDRILDEFRSQLISISSFEETAFVNWVENAGKHYNFLELNDGSRWTFRLGEKKGRYIHFHPCRLSCSFRIRGTTLRTALALKFMAGEKPELYMDYEFVNFIRIKLLQLSPIKSIQNFTAVKKILDLL